MKDFEIKIEPLVVTADNLEQAMEYAVEYFADSNFKIEANEIKELK